MLDSLKKILGFRKIKRLPLKIHILGLDQAGKTTFVNYLRLGEFTKPTRTLGLNIEEVSIEGLNLRIMDLGGQTQFRSSLWPRLLDQGQADIILYVIDASDRVRLLMNQEEFKKLLDHPSLKENKTPIVVLANKQDIPKCMTSGEIAIDLDLIEYSLIGRSFQVFPTSMVTGEGIDDVLEYLKQTDEKNKGP
ncbi:MAG: ADP-ribosylation factor family protein [Candidatus Hodarchaeales archaeon]